MNKVFIKEFEKRYVMVDIIFYCLLVALGFTLLNCGEMGLTNPIKHAPWLFYSIAFFSILAYFVNRRKDEYEFLLFGFINVVVGTFILVYTYYPDSGFILADAILLYSIANVLNKGFSCKKMVEERDINFFTKISVTVLLLFLGVFVVASLYNKVEVGVLILGYYFIIFGLLSLLEPLNSVVLKNPQLQKRIFAALSYDDVKEKKEEPKELTPIENTRITDTPVKKTTTRTRKTTTTKKPTTRKATTKKTTAAKKTTVAKKTTTKKSTTRKTTTRKTTTKK